LSQKLKLLIWKTKTKTGKEYNTIMCVTSENLSLTFGRILLHHKTTMLF